MTAEVRLLHMLVQSMMACACLLLAGCWEMPIVGNGDAGAREGDTPGIPRHSFLSVGPAPTNFFEAPVLAAQVASGTLPPVGERLPAEPLVIAPLERIGRYGGTWRRAFTGPADIQNADRLEHDHLIYFDLDGRTIVPHIARTWEESADGRTFTFHLRPGMKWSDGAPFTADDFLFAYEDVMLRDDLCPSKPTWLRTKSGLGRIEKVDQFTVRIEFLDPNRVFTEWCAGQLVAGQWARSHILSAIYLPRHFLSQFHPKYTASEQLDERSRAAGFDGWVPYFREKMLPHRNPALPTLGPWVTVKPITGEQFVLERNPFYWAVDSAGNQLPYIDRIVMRLAGDPEVLNLRAVAGELDMQDRHIQLSKVPVLHENAERGEYRILLWPDWGGNDCCVYFNQNYDDDPEIAALLRSVDFRKALSLAIDREEINELIFLGTGEPRAFLPPANTPYYPGPQFEMTCAELDRDEARRLLDDLGLNRNAEGIFQRRDRDGTLTITLEVQSGSVLDFRSVAELLERQWRQVGLNVDVAIRDRTFYNERLLANQIQVCLWNPSGSENLWAYPFALVPYLGNTQWAPATGDWYASGGKSGKPPTPTMKRLRDLFELGGTLPLEKRIPIGQEIWKIHCENLFVVGTVGLSPAVSGVVVVKNHFRNVPDVAPNSPMLQNPGIARPETFFFNN